ncbi:YoaK family protein [Nocardiopsis prasina]|uniref:YoaK family protein n=1 Tax=Nocardiopsis prasina TaxID=2015 RepID=UPI0003457CB7|nr:YoaK family protein [Nocardiopsis prasina]
MKDRDTPYLVGLFALTVATGIVDAVSYLALDYVFTGNMTGNVLFVGFGIGGSDSVPLLSNTTALAGFLTGAIAAGRLVRGRTHETRLPTAHLLLLTGTSVAVVVIGLAWLLLSGLAGGWLLGLTAFLAAAMGIQAVAARGAAIPDVNTVVITSTLVNFALDSPLAGGTGEKWVRRAGAVLAMGAGGAIGALLVNSWSGAGALLVGGVCMGVGTLVLAAARRQRR